MAGAGYKLFNTGDVLTAAQVNTYLMQQTVMVFASSAARTTALSGVLAEGMVSYLQDSNTLEVYDGSAWVGATGDITGLTAGTGISISSATGPVPTITNSVATTFDALGDLVVGTGADTFSKLTVGANGESIVADSSASQGLRWQPTGTINGIINGGFDIWQRGTSFASGTAVYSADRWYFYRAGAAAGATFSRQASDLTGFQYFARLQRDNGNSSTAAPQIKTQIESANSYQFAGKTVSVSFWARKGANFSAASDAFQFIVRTGTGVDETINGSFTGGADSITGTATLTSSWQRFTFSGSIPSTTSEIYLLLYYTPVGTAGAADYVDVAGVQFEIGSTATSFRRSGNTLAGELAACRRYYIRFGTGSNYTPYGTGWNASTSAGQAIVMLPVSMRVEPTAVEYANLSSTVLGASEAAITTVTLNGEGGTDSVTLGTASSAAFTTGFFALTNKANTAGYLALTAEL